MSSLAEKLSAIVAKSFEAQGLPPELGAVRVSDRPDLCQFQCNGAMAAAKIAQKNPREIAQAIVADLKDDIFENIEIAGPGFINIDIKNSFVICALADNGQNRSLGIQTVSNDKTVVLDYGGPNVAKPMHVGHLRASIIGDAMRRIYKYSGYNALGDVHMGDWGLPMGQVISELELRHPDWPYFDPEYAGEYPAESPVSIADLEEIYPAASAACKADEARLEMARKATLELQNGRRGYRALWQHFVDVSIAGMKGNFEALGVHFDLWKGEADVHDLIATMVEDLKQKSHAIQSDGALIVPVERNDDKKEVPPLILYKSDGAVMYGTTDLATIVERMDLYAPDIIVYFTDQRQSLHFEQVFRAARLGGIVPERTALIHAGFGTMNGTDGKPFKTRAGGVMKLEDLISMAIESGHNRLKEARIGQDYSENEQKDIAKKVGVAAIKFADLQNNRVADYVFDMDRFTSFEGKTGPYILYQAVRMQSLLHNANESGVWDYGVWEGVSLKEKVSSEEGALMDNVSLEDDIFVEGGMHKEGADSHWLAGDQVQFHNVGENTREIMNFLENLNDEDIELARLICEFPDHFALALQNNTPHVLCDYVYKVAQAFSSYYAQHHILSEKDEALQKARLALLFVTHRTIVTILHLLGIDVPKRM